MSKRLFPDNTAPVGQGRSAEEARDVAISALDRLKPPFVRTPLTSSVRNLKNEN